MSKEIFLIDSNSLITPHLIYYTFDFAPKFWEQMEKCISEGDVVILDMVKNEICKGEDSLKEWMTSIDIECFVDRKKEHILKEYSEVLQHLQFSPYYKPSALTEWSRADVADPWLIATAKVYGYTIITFETKNTGLNENNPSKNAKIPNVADSFGVETKDLFYLMRTLKFRL